MSEIPGDFDFSLVWEALAPDTRAEVRRFCRQLGVPADGWHEIPDVRRFVTTAAVLELADLEGAPNVGDEISDTCRALGMKDDPARSTRPSDSIYRRIRRWRKAAGQRVHSEDADAA